MIVNMHEAKTHLSNLVERAVEGEEIVIARAGEPVARLVPFAARGKPRTLGLFAGQPFWMAEDFDTLPDEVARAFQGLD